MYHTFPYPQFPGIEIPDANLMGVYSLPEAGDVADADTLIAGALAAPIGTPPLRELARGKSRVLVITDDIARPTPAHVIVPHVIRELEAAEVPDGAIEFMMALGTHRPMTSEEMTRKLGKAVTERFVVHNHAWDDPDALVSLGMMELGIEVLMNRKVVEADLVIGIGRIMPIDICGFTGGGKILVPGCCGEATLDAMHWIRVDMPDEDVVGQADNRIRAAIDALAQKAGLDFIVNIVMDTAQQLRACVAGDMVAAHREGCRHARACHAVAIPEAADIVVTDAYPFDIEFWQVNKAVDTAGLVVRPGGVVVAISPCYEGLSRVHADLVLKHGYQTKEKVKALVASGEIHPQVVGVHMIQVGNVALDKASVVLVTDGISEEDVGRMGLGYAATPEAGLAMAFEKAGRDARVAVLRGAAEMLPLVGS